jgi:hypothetical protein
MFMSHYSNDSLFPELHDIMLQLGFHLHNFSTPFCTKGHVLWVDALYAANE